MKPGYRTSEFWVTMIVALCAFLGALPVHGNAKAYVGAALVGLYALSRGLAKIGPAPLTLGPIQSVTGLEDPQLDEPAGKAKKPRPNSAEPEVAP